jgi:LysM repeat protein
MVLAALLLVQLATPTLRAEPKTYTVKPGDSLAKVADFHSVSQSELRRANRLSKTEPLKVGAVIVIPHVLRGGALRKHVVALGDTLAQVASQYEVTVPSLAAANNLQEGSALALGRTLAIPDSVDPRARYTPATGPRDIKSGKVVKNGVLHTVQHGQSLWLIARAYGVGGEKIARANNLKATAALRPGRSILVPGATKVVSVEASSTAVQPIRFVRNLTAEEESLVLVSNDGKVLEKSRKRLSELCHAKDDKKKVMLLNRRLIVLLQQVADRFPGKTFEIISGYRPYEEGHESKHSLGRAMDFRIVGASNREVYDYIKKLPNVGAGYYPNSAFVHLDVRDRTTLWVDSSGAGQKPRYTSKGFARKKKS